MPVTSKAFRRGLLLGAVPLFCLFTGCSSFSRAWKHTPNRLANDPVAGRWEGTWKSDASSHSDKLRCLLKPIAPGTYEARFHAKYKKVLSFGYTATFRGNNTDGVFQFEGEADLGKLAGGIYRYKGTVSPTNFESTYRCKYDHGTFTLHRPAE
jgi:hypothetical protein